MEELGVNFVAIVIALVAGAVLAVVLVHRGGDVGLRAEVERISRRIGEDNSVLSQRLESINDRLMHTQVANQDLATNIFHTLGDLKRSTDSVAEQAKEFTALQDLLRAPKMRGGLGEAMLEELLRQILPPSSFEMQHRFSSGTIVDAVVKAGGRIICIDSKFPMENYERIHSAADDAEKAAAEKAFLSDVSKHIQAISSRYILPDEGTMDFAVMYVPAEGVYGELLRLSSKKGSISEIAINSRVVPMSPLTMYGYLQTILFGLKCMQIEANAEEILDFCGRLHHEMELFAQDYETIGRHLTNARTRYDGGVRRLDRVRDRLGQVASSGEAPPEPISTEQHERLTAVND